MENASTSRFLNCHDTANAVEKYINKHLFNPRNGIMYSGIDSRTDMPFDRDFITPLKVPRRANFDPWSYWTYEDSVMSMGLYLDGLILQHEVTGCSACIERAGRIWNVIKAIYSCSQVHGMGSFLRPYGGFKRMDRFMEPLGTDQASPLFSGLYRYLPYASPQVAADIRRLMIGTLTWYEQQGFEYFYYKTFIHSYAPDDPRCQHANSYYLPAIAWAADNFPEDLRWRRHLDERLGFFISGRYKMYPHGSHQPAFCWGSDLDILHQLLGSRFNEVFEPCLLDEAYQSVSDVLSEYREPGMIQLICPESANSNFMPTVKTDGIENDEFGFAYGYTRHHGRRRPRHEIDFLTGLVAIGYRTDEIAPKVAELLTLFKNVPHDFTAFLSEDYHLLPETVHLYARSVGVIMVSWLRNYWMLRHVEKRLPIGHCNEL